MKRKDVFLLGAALAVAGVTLYFLLTLVAAVIESEPVYVPPVLTPTTEVGEDKTEKAWEVVKVSIDSLSGGYPPCATKDGELVCVDFETMEVVKVEKVDGMFATMYIDAANYCFDYLVWNGEKTDHPCMSAPHTYRNTVAVPVGGKAVVLEDGQVVGEYPSGNIPPLVCDEGVYTVSEGRLYRDGQDVDGAVFLRPFAGGDMCGAIVTYGLTEGMIGQTEICNKGVQFGGYKRKVNCGSEYVHFTSRGVAIFSVNEIVIVKEAENAE